LIFRTVVPALPLLIRRELENNDPLDGRPFRGLHGAREWLESLEAAENWRDPAVCTDPFEPGCESFHA
jgi:hypothetical protein